MAGTEVRFASNNVTVPDDAVADLAERIAAESNGRAAADELRENHRFANETQKQVALDAIEQWMKDVDVSSLPQGIMLARDELMRDLRRPPFDT